MMYIDKLDTKLADFLDFVPRSCIPVYNSEHERQCQMTLHYAKSIHNRVASLVYTYGVLLLVLMACYMMATKTGTYWNYMNFTWH